MGQLFAKATRRTSLAHIRYVTPVAPHAATGLVARVYGQVEADFGMLAPPVALHAPAPDALAASWSTLRETTLVTGLVGRAAKEVVAATVSLANRCPYCVDVHGATLAGLVRGPDAPAIAGDRIDSVADPGLRSLARWARASGGATGSRPRAPFPPPHAPELIGVAVAFHYLNRMVNVFLRDSPLPPVPGPALATVRRGAAWMMGRMARGAPLAGVSLDLLPESPLPPDLSWAAGQPHVAAALARASEAIDAGGRRAVPDGVRQLVAAKLVAAQMAGEDDTAPGGIGGRRWLAEAVADLPDVERPAARLALLIALASYRVTDTAIDEFRDQGHDDKALMELASWASLTAARRIGTGLHRDLDSLARDA